MNVSESGELAVHDAPLPPFTTPTHDPASVTEVQDAAGDVSELPEASPDLKVEDGPNDLPMTTCETEPPSTLTTDPPADANETETKAILESAENSEIRNNKRKRAVSPPWQFPSVDTATMKSADGRRVSARVHVSTPGASESEGHGRSASQSMTRSRPASPPWKKFAAEGPTSLSVDGKRKSGRVNRELMEPPKRVSPRTKKHADKQPDASRGKARSEKKPVNMGEDYALSMEEVRALSPASRIKEIQRRIAALKPTRSFPTPEPEEKPAKGRPGRKRKRSSAVHEAEQHHAPKTPIGGRRRHTQGETSPSHYVTRPSPRIKLRFNSHRDPLPPPHPNAVASSPARPPRISVFQVLEHYDLAELQHPYVETGREPPDEQFFVQRSEKHAADEAEIRAKILRAAEPDGPLSKEKLSIYIDERPTEPLQQYGLGDHIVQHALYFRALQEKELRNHKLLAKKVAQEALEYWKAMRGPTEEDIRAEQDKMFRLIYKQVATDVQLKWNMVNAHVQQLRKERWEAEEDARRQERLQKQLEWSERMIAKQRGDDSDVDMEEDSVGAVEGSGSQDEESEEENMSSSDSESEEEAEESGGGAELAGDELAAYLAFREAQPAEDGQDEDQDPEDDDDDDVATPGPDGALSILAEDLDDNDPDEDSGEEFAPEAEDEAPTPLDDTGTPLEQTGDEAGRTSKRLRRSESVMLQEDQPEAEQDLSSDESVDMDDSDENISSSEDEVEQTGSESGNESGEEDVGSSLFGFLFPQKQLKGIGLPTPTTSADEGDERERAVDGPSDEQPEAETTSGAVVTESAIEDVPMANDIEAAVEHLSITQNTNGDVSMADGAPTQDKPSPVKEHASIPVVSEASASPEPAQDNETRALIPAPDLLRGTLRSYQHAGLDWLASLYRNGTNGILADEMGLGKTIQTIALLGHLAEQHDIWDMHLIIVPTSVVLNWVTEFQKFLPGFRVLGYYGNTDERALKRKGWRNDPHHPDKTKRGYNVVITSYHVATADYNALKAVPWHYLVLDEAHNIRNFNSQRWQMLIRLRTKARLLLTGTPLQNSLTELWALLTFLTAGDDDPAHGDLEEFLSHWKEPVKEIFERGVTALSTEAQKVVDQLHISLRPFLLRRLKTEVEKDLPKKTEKVVVCKLSKRQRQLYQEYMGLAAVRESLRKGNAVSAGKVLLSLRRVCNHPDLFDPRPIQTSYAMEQSAVDPFVIKESLIRRMLGSGEERPRGLLVTNFEYRDKKMLGRSRQLGGNSMLRKELAKLEKQSLPTADVSTPAGCLTFQRLQQRNRKLQELRHAIRTTEFSLADAPVYGSDLCEFLTVKKVETYWFNKPGIPRVKTLRGYLPFGQYPVHVEHRSEWMLATNTRLQQEILTLDKISESLNDVLIRFAFCTPVATAPILDHAIPRPLQEQLRLEEAYPVDADYAHEARARTSIVFPDKRLLVYDSGKLQQLTSLLRELQSRGSRSLIFTQMTGTLNILEQFLNLLNLPYLRLDGSTPVEKRQLYSLEFNRPDSKYQCMILSSRAGGVGLNLIGASSVIFFDLDWNPQMDRQCMDRAHRIGQVRDVEVFKMVSEKTVEENILRRANQKSLLDQTVIQEGHFTTEYQQPTRPNVDADEDEDNVEAAIERFLGVGDKGGNTAMESVEDKEDVQAAQAARKEEHHQDDADFAERTSKGPSAAATPGPGGLDVVDEERQGHVDLFMIREVERWWRGVPYVPPKERKLDKHGRDPSHRAKKKR